MKRNMLVSILVAATIATSSLGIASAVNSQPVKAITKSSLLDSRKPINIVLTKTVKIQKEKMAKAHCYVRAVGKQKTLKKGTKLQILPGGMDYNWILIKKGYTHSGVKLTKKSYQIKTHGYLWVVSKNYLDDNWFKLL